MIGECHVIDDSLAIGLNEEPEVLIGLDRVSHSEFGEKERSNWK